MSDSQTQVPTATIDPIELRRVCATFGTGVTVITARHANSDHGMTANAFMSVSLEPPLIVVSVNRRARLLQRIEAAGRYGVSILAEHMEPVALHFAGKPRAGMEEVFEDFDGLPVVRGAIAHFAAKLHQVIEAGDHVLFIGAVEKIARTDGRPLIFQDGQFQTVPYTPSSTAANAAFGAWPSRDARDLESNLEETPEFW
jgi:flavin reductase (DIM6/NTAB) family NADH-FMN oxidoreductase RutF